MFVSSRDAGQVTINGVTATPGKPYALAQNSIAAVVATANSGFEFSQWSGDLTGDSSSGSIVMSCDKIITAHYVQAEPIVTTPIYYPHIACADGWETRLCLINRNATDLSGIFYAYNDKGDLLDSTNRLTLAAGGRIQFQVSQNFIREDEIGYVIFAAETDSAAGIVGYTKFYIDGRYRVAVPLVTRVNQGDIFVSHIDSEDKWWTGVSLLNTTDKKKELTFVFDNGASETVALAAKEHRAIKMSTLWQRGSVGSAAHSAVIQNAAGIVGLELFSQGDQLSGILIKDQTATEIYYPHIAVADVWWTGVVAYNATAEMGKLTFTAYSDAGTDLGEKSDVSIAGHSQYVGSVAELDFPAGTAWFKVKSEQPIVGFELFGTANGNQLAGYSGAAISGVEGVLPKLESEGYTGIAMVNTTAATAKITLTAYKNDGTVVATEEDIVLNGYAKIVDEAENLFSQDISRATYITYKSNRELVAFQINGANDNMMLDALPALR